MALPFTSNGVRKRDQLVAIDLGGRTTKAVHIQRKGEGFVLSGYTLVDAPIYEKHLSAELLAEHLNAVCQGLDAKTKVATLAIGVHDSIVRHAELPLMPVGDMRLVLKNSSKTYLQQDLPNYVFDCFCAPSRQAPPKPPEKGKAPAGPIKQRVLVAGARKQTIDDLQSAMKTSGLMADSIVPGLLGPINAFERAFPESFAKEVVALVDIGFRNTSISILQEGDLILSRVVGLGGDRLTSGLAESLGISYAEAEGIKVGMPQEVESNLESMIVPLGRELRASIDFFEHQQDRPVAAVYIGGATAQSELILRMLQNELMAECRTWNPTQFLELALPPQQTAEIEQVAPQLSVAVGAAMTVL